MKWGQVTDHVQDRQRGAECSVEDRSFLTPLLDSCFEHLGNLRYPLYRWDRMAPTKGQGVSNSNQPAKRPPKRPAKEPAGLEGDEKKWQVDGPF